MWISVKDRLPSDENGHQVEVVFFAKLYEWWTGLFTPKGKWSDSPVFEYHQHWGDDKYHAVSGVQYWMPLPNPPAAERGGAEKQSADANQQANTAICNEADCFMWDRNCKQCSCAYIKGVLGKQQ